MEVEKNLELQCTGSQMQILPTIFLPLAIYQLSQATQANPPLPSTHQNNSHPSSIQNPKFFLCQCVSN